MLGYWSDLYKFNFFRVIGDKYCDKIIVGKIKVVFVGIFKQYVLGWRVVEKFLFDKFF